MPLNHPQTITPPVRGKAVFHETSPWCQKGWGLLLGQCYPEYTESIISFFEGLLEASLLLLPIWLLCTFCPLLRSISRWIWQWEGRGKGLGGNCPLLWIFFLMLWSFPWIFIKILQSVHCNLEFQGGPVYVCVCVCVCVACNPSTPVSLGKRLPLIPFSTSLLSLGQVTDTSF